MVSISPLFSWQSAQQLCLVCLSHYPTFILVPPLPNNRPHPSVAMAYRRTKQPQQKLKDKSPPTDKGINELWYIYTVGCYSAIKWDKVDELQKRYAE